MKTNEFRIGLRVDVVDVCVKVVVILARHTRLSLLITFKITTCRDWFPTFTSLTTTTRVQL